MQNRVPYAEIDAFSFESHIAPAGVSALRRRAAGKLRSAALLGIAALGSSPPLAAQPPAFAALLTTVSAQQRVTPTPTGTTGSVGRPFESPPDAPAVVPSAAVEGRGQEEGIYAHSGEFWARAVDLHVRGRGLDFVWQRKYRSRFGPNTAQGNGWDYSYNLWIESGVGGVRVHDGNTRVDLFRPDASGKYSARQFFCEGELLPDGSFRLVFPDLGTWSFRALASTTAPGRIAAIADRHGNTLTFHYDGIGRLAWVVDTLGRTYSIGYDTSGRIVSVSDFAGRSVTYAYYTAGELGGSDGDLKSTTSPIVVGTPTGNDFPAGKRTAYTYSSGQAALRLNHNLLTIVEPSGRIRCVNEYASTNDPAQLEFDRLVRQRRGEIADTLELAYAVPTGTPSEALVAIQNDRVGNVRELYYDGAGRCLRERRYTGRAVNGVPTTATVNRPSGKLRTDDPDWFETLCEYDDDGLVTRIVHPAGNITRYVHESALDPFAPVRARGNLRELRRERGTHALAADQAAGTVELFEYESSISGFSGTGFLRRHTDARGNVTEHIHDLQGNCIRTIQRIPSIVEDYTYDTFGRITSHTRPTDGNGVRRRDEYHWYGPIDGPQNGYLRARVDDASGLALATVWTYDVHGCVVSATDPRGNDTLFVHNALEQVVVRQSPGLSGPGSPRQETRFFYDFEDELIWIDRDNRDEHGALSPVNPSYTTTFAYGQRGELVARTDEADATRSVSTEYVWDGNQNLVLLRQGEAVNGNQAANTIALAYDERDLPWRTTRAAGTPDVATDQTDYDANGNLRALRRGLEGFAPVETRFHDALDRLRTRVDALGNVTSYHYDPNGNPGGNVGSDAVPVPNPFAEQVFGQLVDVPGSAGNRRLSETTHVYDALDRLVRTDVRHFDTQTQGTIGDGQSRTTQTWTGNSLLATLTLDGAGHTTHCTYDTLGRLVQRRDAEDNLRSWTYDAAGNAISIVDVDRADTGAPDQTFTTSYGYDALDRKTLEVDGVGMIRTWGWDGLGRLARVTDRGGRMSRHEYDGLGRLVRVGHDMDGNGVDTDPTDVVLRQVWDDSSRCVSRTDGTFQTTRFAWDALDRHIATLHADGALEQNGTGLSWWLGQTVPSLAAFVSGYDARDNLVTRTDANGTVVTTVHDLLDRRTSVDVLRGSGVGGTTAETWQYDGLSRFVRADVFVDHIPSPASSSLQRGSVSTSGYDSLGNVLRESRTIQGGPVRSRIATFDGESNLTELLYPASAGSTLRVRWTYDGLGRPLSVRDATAATVLLATLAYIGPDRLERIDRLNDTRTSVEYDGIAGVPNPPGDLGFRREIERRHVRQPSGSLLAGQALRWDQAGAKSQAQDLVGGSPTSYGHDALERLVHSSSPIHPSIDYVLDAAGSRTFVNGGSTPGPYTSSPVHTYDSTPFDTRGHDAAGNLTSRNPPGNVYVYDYADRLIEVNDGATQVRHRYDGLGRCVEKWNGALIERYDYDPLGRMIEVQNVANLTQSQFVHADGSGTPFLWRRSGTRYFLHTDDLGSVVCVSDAGGNVAARYRYSDFGEHEVGPANTGQGGNQAGMALSDEDFHCALPTSQRADDFTLTQPSLITSLRWWGGYDCAVAPFSDNFIVEIRDDAGGAPGPSQLVLQWIPNIARAATGAMLPGAFGSVQEYEYTVALNLPFHALAGVRYWLCVRRAGDGSHVGWGWEASAQGNGSDVQSVNFGPWSPASGDRAFSLELSSPAIPLSPFLFHGQWYDADSGLYRVGSRAYEPAVGAFLQRDPQENGNWLANLGRPNAFASNAPTNGAGVTKPGAAGQQGRGQAAPGQAGGAASGPQPPDAPPTGMPPGNDPPEDLVPPPDDPQVKDLPPFGTPEWWEFRRKKEHEAREQLEKELRELLPKQDPEASESGADWGILRAMQRATRAARNAIDHVTAGAMRRAVEQTRP